MQTRAGLYAINDDNFGRVRVKHQQQHPVQRNLDEEVLNLDHTDCNVNPDNTDNIEITDNSEIDSIAQMGEVSEDSEEYRSSSEDISEDENEHLGRENQARWNSEDETMRLRTTTRVDSPELTNPSDSEKEDALRTMFRSIDQDNQRLRRMLKDQKSHLERRERDLEQAQAKAREESDVATERAITIEALENANTNLNETINDLKARDKRQNSAIDDLNIRLNKALEETRGLANLQVSLGTANGIQNELTVLRQKVSRALGENSQILKKLDNKDAKLEELQQFVDKINSTPTAPVLASAPPQWSMLILRISFGAVVCLSIIAAYWISSLRLI